MRIVGGNATSNVGKSTGSGRARSTSGSFVVPQQSEETAQSQKSYQSNALQDVSSLLALQGVEDSTHGKRRKAIRRGNKMLDLLEQVRMGLLAGAMSMTVLKQLERLAENQEPSGDERIDELLLEIGLRAQVEIAKLEANDASMK